MKARHFRKVRKRLGNKKWLKAEIEKQYEVHKFWNSFEIFECSDHFRGYELSKHNRKKLRKGVARLTAKIKYLELRLKKL